MATVGTLGLQTIVARTAEILHTEVDGDVALMSTEMGKYYALRSVGARIWTLLEGSTTAAEICERLMAEYRIDQVRCEDEVLRFLRRMSDEGVVTTKAA